MLFFGQEEQPKKKFFWPVLLAAVFFILADLAAASYLAFELLYSQKVYPGVKVGQINLGGKTRAEAKKIINEKISDFNQNGIIFSFQNNEIAVLPIISSFSGDLARELISFDAEQTVNNAYAYGRSGNFWKNLRQKINFCQECKNVGSAFQTDDEGIREILKEHFSSLEQPAANAKLYATTTPNYWKKEILFKISEEKNGWSFDYNSALLDLKADLSRLENIPVEMNTLLGSPTIKKNECQNIEVEAEQFLDKAELVLTYKDKKWPVNKETISGWLALARGTNNKIIIDLDAGKIQAFLAAKAAPEITIEPTNARFEIKDNRVVEFASSRDGQKIDYPQTIANLRSGFLAKSAKTSEIAVIAVKSELKTEKANDLGIREIIGTGHSNFAGSPKNRVHNIGTGAAAMNGLLVAPGEEFSVDTALGLVDGTTGYLPEMTIKGDKTVPEYGGGLCQIGTTMFRAALASGFPITARQPHSYRVVYYEPAGTDATIYQPWPDLRFINDSPNYVLIQTHASGSDLYFDFWGTKDGRAVELTDPTIYNIVKPPPTKIVETTDLPVGQKKCTERAHNGADAYFDYKVTYPDGTVKEKRFKSHYVPWQEVCLVGVEKTATTTTEIIK